MRLSGRMAIRAYLHPRATVGEAIVAVKVSISSTLYAQLFHTKVFFAAFF